MKTSCIVLVVALAAIAAAAAQSSNVTTNVCNLNWSYCPRDPGCITYTMSVHNVMVHADGVKDIKAEDIKPGQELNVAVTGITTMKTITPDGSYRIYSLDGKNMGAGVLKNVLHLEGDGSFLMELNIMVTADAIGAGGFFEFGIDVFQQASGSDEGMCLEIASTEYEVYEEHKLSPPFVMYCFDNGDGTFRAGTHEIHPKLLPSPPCGEAECDLHWYYCPRDPGCVTYTMTVDAVSVDVSDLTGVHAGDAATVIVNGTTSLKSIEDASTYRIYDLAGHNAAAGLLKPIMSLYDCNDEGCSFGLAIGFELVSGCFDAATGWFEFGLDIFQQSSETDEGVCIEVTNQAYLTYEETHTQPPPGFVTYCLPSPYGKFHKVTPPPAEVVDVVNCELK